MASWNHDGTQDPKPPPLMTDPLSGLVTGGRYDGEAVRVRVVEPAAPDIEAVRSAMESVLDENSELRVDLLGSGPATTELPARQAPAAPEVKVPTPTPPTGFPLPPARFGAMRGGSPRRRGMRMQRPRRRWSPGVGAIAVLLLVMAVLAIVMFASFVDAISSLFS